jgi:hypothetical protein
MNNPTSVYDLYKLKTWVDPKRIFWWNLAARENAIPFIEKHIDLLDDHSLEKLSKNPFAVDMLERHIDKILWNDFVHNPNAIHLIEKNIDICFKSLNTDGRINLLRHPNFVHIIDTHTDKIIDELLNSSCICILARSDNPIYIELLEKFIKKYPEKNMSYIWKDLCENPLTVHIIKQNLHKLNNNAWQMLAKNPNAIPIIQENLYKLDDSGWRYLTENPNAISILEEHLDKINWYALSCNKNGVQILEKNIDKIACYAFFDYKTFSVNAPIFEIDYETISKRCSIYKEELMQVALHPDKIEKYLQQGILVEDLDKYI